MRGHGSIDHGEGAGADAGVFPVTSGAYTQAMAGDVEDPETVKTRVLALLDFLEEFHRRRHPPVRDIADLKDFVLRRGDLTEAAGVTFSPGASSWLSAKLMSHPPRPALPPDLIEIVAESTLTPHVAPTIPDDAFVVDGEPDVEARAVAEKLLGEWIDDTWWPWSEQWREIDAGRALYKRLFDVRTRLDRNRDSLELVWGFGRVRWRHPTGELVDHPLVTVPVEIELDRASGRLELGPEGSAALEFAFLSELTLADRTGYVEARQSFDDDADDLWAPGFSDRVAGLLRMLDHDGEVVDEPARAIPPHATVSLDWMLYLRRRQADYLGFLDEQRALYAADPAAVPAPFASLVADEPSRLASAIEGARGGGDDERLLLPLPANDEQHAILRRAQWRPGVTAQGPPGTGKSHTIANLVSHFVAHGKRVLVTAEKEQALSVLAEKLPEGIRALAVAHLGTDAASRTRLERSINAMQTALHSPTAILGDDELQRIEADLDAASARMAETRTALSERRAAEVEGLPAALRRDDIQTPSVLADWVRSHEAELGFVPDPVGRHHACPLDAAQLAELARLAAHLEPTDADAARRNLPALDLPPASALALEDDELQRIDAQLADTGVDDWSAVDGCDPSRLGALASDVGHVRQWFDERVGTWCFRIRDELADVTLAADWAQFVTDVSTERETALAHARAVQAYQVDIPVEGSADPAFLQALDDTRARFAAGKGRRPLAGKGVKRVLRDCKVNGHAPASVEDVDLCLAEAALRDLRRRLMTRWTKQTARVDAPALDQQFVEHGIGAALDEIARVLAWEHDVWHPLRGRLEAVGVHTRERPDQAELARLDDTCGRLALRHRATGLRATRHDLTSRLLDGATSDGASPLWGALATALRTSDWAAWDRDRDEVGRLLALRDDAERLHALAAALGTTAPEWASSIVRSRGDLGGPASACAHAWSWRQAETWLTQHAVGPSSSELQHRLEDLERTRLRVTSSLVEGRAWRALQAGFTDQHRAALQAFTLASRRLGKAKGKYAGHFGKQVREALDDAKDAVPVWIMPLSRVLGAFRPSAEPPFDVLIVDEASQVGLAATPVLALARKTIVVGDDQQTSPENVGLELGPIHELLHEHLRGIPKYEVVFDPASSLYDMARTKFPDIVMLKEHFRSLPEIIEFSNQLCYGGEVVPLRDQRPSPGWQPVGTVRVRNGVRHRGTDVNEPEARAVVDLIAELIDDERYAGKSFGVVSLLGTKQSQRIQDLLLDRLGPGTVEERAIRCGEAATFQGDERDVMVLSLVVAPNEEGDLRFGAMTKKADIQRINVAASRARDQMWIVHSVATDDFSPGDPRAELIRHCASPASLPELVDRAAERCESDFERKVVQRVLARGYRRVRVQYPVNRYRIDFVVEGPESRLAVECDGDAWHGPERWEADRARQAVLERAGWTFERIAGSAFYRDPDGALEPLWARLDELGIPTGDWQSEGAPTAPSAREVTIDLGAPEPDIRSRPPRTTPRLDAGTMAQPGRRNPPSTPAPTLATGEPVAAAGHRRGGEAARPIKVSAAASRTSPVDPSHQTGRGSGARVHSRNPARRVAQAAQVDDGTIPAVGQELPRYHHFRRRGLVPGAVAAPVERVVETLVEIVSVEGPVYARRAFELYQRQAGGNRVRSDTRAALIAALDRAVADGRIARISDDLPDPVDKTLYIPGTDPVVVRSRGERRLEDIPRSEVATLADRLGVRGKGSEQAMRAILGTYGVSVFDDRSAGYLGECLDYRWSEGSPEAH